MDLLPLLNLLNAAKSPQQGKSNGDSAPDASLDAIVAAFQQLLEQNYQQPSSTESSPDNSTKTAVAQGSSQPSSDDSNVDWSLIAGLLQFVPLNQFIPTSGAQVSPAQLVSPELANIAATVQLPSPIGEENLGYAAIQPPPPPAIPLLLLNQPTSVLPVEQGQQINPLVLPDASSQKPPIVTGSAATNVIPQKSTTPIPIPAGLVPVTSEPIVLHESSKLTSEPPQTIALDDQSSTPTAATPERQASSSAPLVPVQPSPVTAAPPTGLFPPVPDSKLEPQTALHSDTEITSGIPSQSLPSTPAALVTQTTTELHPAEGLSQPSARIQAENTLPPPQPDAVPTPALENGQQAHNEQLQPIPVPPQALAADSSLVDAQNVAPPEGAGNSTPSLPNPPQPDRSNGQQAGLEPQPVVAQTALPETSSQPVTPSLPVTSRHPLGKSGNTNISSRASRSLDLTDLIAEYAKQQAQQITPVTEQTGAPASDAGQTVQVSDISSRHTAEQVISQVTTAATTSLQEMSHIQVDLHPHDLGQIRVEVTRHNDQLSARIEVAQSHTHRLLTESASQLTESLAGQGITVDRVDITYRPNLNEGNSANTPQGNFSGGTRNFASGGQEEAPNRRQPQQEAQPQFLRRDPPQSPAPTSAPRGARLKDLDIKI